ncbi:MAG: hypothetical protein JRI34_05140 [Deltaproteobacteria bacterium]|nr:hypothetical protein [Deltaproteobacteria bacterium]
MDENENSSGSGVRDTKPAVNPALRSFGKFFRETLKLGLALSLALVLLTLVLGAVFLGYSYWQQKQNELELAPLREAKNWPASKVVNSTMEARLTTKYREGKILLRFSVGNLPSTGLVLLSGAHFNIMLEDDDGFPLVEHQILVSDMFGIHATDGEKITGYRWEGAIQGDIATYRQVKGWEVSWAGVKVAKETSKDLKDLSPSPPVAKWRSRENWRKLRRGMSQSKVRQLLGEPTYVEARGITDTYWVYGGRSRAISPYVEFFLGDVSGWAEP